MGKIQIEKMRYYLNHVGYKGEYYDKEKDKKNAYYLNHVGYKAALIAAFAISLSVLSEPCGI